ncbi:MAG: serine/threonine-protein kinase [Acidobacteriota bacterium]
MNPEQWQQVRRVLAEALEVEASDRPAFLDEACGDSTWLRDEVDSLIRSHDDATTFVDRPIVDLTGGDSELERIGPYRLLEKLGQGGMGTVYLAERDDEAYRQKVAVKLLQRGRDSDELLRRFRGERQILAQLEHPHIARLLDGGSAEDGRPYLVMEHVRGQPIDVYCDRHQLGIPERLELFAQVCSATQFAHQSLVVHRDIKPGNILVTEDGEPKLLDFGIAKFLRPEAFPQTLLPTATGFVPLTPEYASPEQVQGTAITTASDVYSLGVLLYELLTGHRPYEFPGRHLAEIVRRVCDEEPTRLSSVVSRPRQLGDGTEVSADDLAARRGFEPKQLKRRLNGDLDRIVAKTLDKDPRQRYASAEQLAEDIRRHLRGHPVRARRGTFRYRASKFISRHRWAVASATSAFVALLIFTAVLASQQEKLRFQRNRAEEVLGLLLEVFAMPDPTRSRGESVTARELLDRGADSIMERFSDQPEVRSELMSMVGQTYSGLGLLEEASELLEGAVAIDAERSDTSPEASQRLRSLAEVLTVLGDYDGSEEAAREALRQERARHRGAHGDVALTLIHLGRILARRGDLASAEEPFSEALGMARRLDEPETLAQVLDYYAGLKDDQGQFADARSMFREALDLLTDLHGDLHTKVAIVLNNLASVVQKEDAGEAEALYRRAETMQRRLFDGPHQDLASTLNNLGLLYVDERDYGEAEPLLEEALKMRREVYGESHPRLAQSLSNLADLQAVTGRPENAEAYYHQAIEMYERELGAGHAKTALARNGLGQLLYAQGRTDEAGELWEQALPAVRRTFGSDHPHVGTILNNQATVLLRRGEVGEARSLFAEVVRIHRGALGGQHFNLGQALFNYGRAASREGDQEEALDSVREAVAICGQHWPQDNRELVRMKTFLAQLEVDVGDADEGRRLAREALEVLEAEAPGSGWTHLARELAGGGP